MKLRPYQEEAILKINEAWKEFRRTLLVLPTGTGKTVVFANVSAQRAQHGRVLILAHRDELIRQAADKIQKACGLSCAVEKAEETALGSSYNITCGSVQTLMRQSRLERFPRDYYDTIIIDEAHHALSDSYRGILDYWDRAKVLGVTATPDRGDKRNLGEVFESVAFEYSIRDAIREGWLSRIVCETIPLKIDLSNVHVKAGDYDAGEIGTALEPYLEEIAGNIPRDRRTLIFLPLVATSKRMMELLKARGFRAEHIDGKSADRREILERLKNGEIDVLCNSMLLTEGFDEPSIDCVVCLRPTKSRALYCLDSQTEILTKDGWKKDVDIGELVAAFDKNTSEICFVPALGKVRRKLEEDEYFCSIKGPSVDIRVSNKHRMLYDNKRRKGWKIKTAEDLVEMADGCYLPISGYGRFKGVPLTDDEIRFIAWVMADGCINKCNNAIQITQGEQRSWLENIQKCIDGCGFKYGKYLIKYDSQFKTDNQKVVWIISKGKPRGRDAHKRGWGDLEDFLSKDISPLLFDMTEKQFKVMLEVLHLGDGVKYNGSDWTQRSYHIISANKVFAENLQRMAIMRGYRANISERLSNAKTPIWTIHIKKQEFVNIGSKYDGRPTWIKEAHTNEECWCIENKLGTLVTRRNGKVTIMGNCQCIGRGTRIAPGKENLLVLDFLWHSAKHDLCHAAHLIAPKAETAAKMREISEKKGAGCHLDLMELEDSADKDIRAQREGAVADRLKVLSTRSRKLLDPLQYALSVHDDDLYDYEPEMPWEFEPPTEKQLACLEDNGFDRSTILTKGYASKILNRIDQRYQAGLCTPKQMKFLQRYGYKNAGNWSRDAASATISMIYANNFKKPYYAKAY